MLVALRQNIDRGCVVIVRVAVEVPQGVAQAGDVHKLRLSAQPTGEGV